MTTYGQSYARHAKVASSTLGITGRTAVAVAGAVRVLKLTLSDALYAYAVTGSGSQPYWCSPRPIWSCSCAASSTERDEPSAPEIG
jgi:hypothetical protein